MTERLPADLQDIANALAGTRAYAQDERRRRLALAGILAACLVPFVTLAATIAAGRASTNAPAIGLGAALVAVVGVGYAVKRLFRYLDPVGKHTGGLYAVVGLGGFLLAGIGVWQSVSRGGLLEFPIAAFAFVAAMYVLQGLQTKSAFWLGLGVAAGALSAIGLSLWSPDLDWTMFGALLLLVAVLVPSIVYVANRRGAAQ